MIKSKPKNFAEYMAEFPRPTQIALKQIREIIKTTVPQAEETISYGMPTFMLNGHYLIYFAGYKKHIGLYPAPSGNKTFEKDFAAYKTSGKGTIQFPLGQSLPTSLIKKIIKYRLSENLKTSKTKKND